MDKSHNTAGQESADGQTRYVTRGSHPLQTTTPGIPASRVVAVVVRSAAKEVGQLERMQEEIDLLTKIMGLLVEELPPARRLEILNTISHGWSEVTK